MARLGGDLGTVLQPAVESGNRPSRRCWFGFGTWIGQTQKLSMLDNKN
jgi:hypothetical protein